ncbi:uncharacterized protein N7459_006648 [Penicillium hispanicum]|uniref:uncharacterized protein n=1 Tax=Penicillium hispanicum TaxID=1080232 RepID=UPI0025411632|nr:uncharacterized protein N7459_006648 [Penicillium hispanicum]KAJ5577684.1 hypothetical protein N7459_006648 [Penicillium hispanicum]
MVAFLLHISHWASRPFPWYFDASPRPLSQAASSARAGCTNKECKDAKVKIGKGELRVGTWIENERFQSGCVTPKVLANIRTAWEDIRSDETDYNSLDGYEELPELYQAKIRDALEQGHVDNADWKGDLECNQPGAKFFRVPGSKKKKQAEDADAKNGDSVKPSENTQEKAADVKDDDSKPGGKKARATKNGTEEEKPTKNGKKPAAKKKGTSDETSADADVDAGAQSKKRGRPQKAGAEDSTKPAKKGTKRKATKDDYHEAAGEEKPKRRGRPTKGQKSQTDDQDGAPEKPKRGRKKATESD